MRFCCLRFLGSSAIARADVIFGGLVRTNGVAVPACSASGTAVGSLYLLCGDLSGPSGYAWITGSGDAFSGLAGLHVDGPHPDGFSQAELVMQLNETYMLVGGTGSAVVNFDTEWLFDAGPTISCSFTFNGVMDPSRCQVGDTFSETVQYDVPFTVEYDVQIDGGALPGDPEDATVEYDFAQPGLVTTPEPASVWLLLPGLVGIGFATRSRAKGWLGGGGSIPHSSR
jgi:hypothetical protein